MSKPNHHSLAYKMRAKPNKTWKDLKQKQKMRISNWMFQKVCEYYAEHGAAPEGEDASKIAREVYHKTQSVAIWVPYEEFYSAFLAKLPRYEVRIAENGIPPQDPEKKEQNPAAKKNPSVKKKGRSKKVCPNCGRKMKVQFNGLQHCKCGVSWIKSDGYFVRTGNMVFALERRRIGKKVKQYPVIRYRRDDAWENAPTEFLQEEDGVCFPEELPW